MIGITLQPHTHTYIHREGEKTKTTKNTHFVPQSGEVKTKRVPVSPTQGAAVTHPVPDVVRFTRVGHMLTVRYLCLVAIVTVTHCPQRQRRHKVETESDHKKNKG